MRCIYGCYKLGWRVCVGRGERVEGRREYPKKGIKKVGLSGSDEGVLVTYVFDCFRKE